MKSIFFGLFFFILCAQALLSSGSESSFKLKNQDFNLSNRLVQGLDVQGMNSLGFYVRKADLILGV